MSVFSGKPVTVPVAREEMYSRVSDLTGLKQRIEALPADMLAQVGDVEFIDADSFAINAPGLGRVEFHVTERVAPERVVMGATAGMIPLSLILNLKEAGEGKTDLIAGIDVDVPVMLRPMIGEKMKEAADKFAEMIGRLNGYEG